MTSNTTQCKGYTLSFECLWESTLQTIADLNVIFTVPLNNIDWSFTFKQLLGLSVKFEKLAQFESINGARKGLAIQFQM